MDLEKVEKALVEVTHSSQLRSVVALLVRELASYQPATLEHAPDPEVEALKARVAELEERVQDLEDAPAPKVPTPAPTKKQPGKKAQR